jgi:hypothetical protein
MGAVAFGLVLFIVGMPIAWLLEKLGILEG